MPGRTGKYAKTIWHYRSPQKSTLIDHIDRQTERERERESQGIIFCAAYTKEENNMIRQRF